MSTRPDLSAVDVDLAAVLGLYETHRFCMRLSADVSLLNEDGSPKAALERDVLVVLVHEYFHYLHNLSTASGFAAFQLLQQLLALLSHAMREDGTVDPGQMAPGLSDNARDTVAALAALEGARSLPSHPSRVVALSVERAQVVPITVRDVQVREALVTWNVERRDGTKEQPTLPVGAFFIEEGIAYLVEEFVRHGRVTYEEGHPERTPEYPYRAYRGLVSFLAPDASPMTAVRLGVLALCTNRPGPTLLQLLRAYQRLRGTGANDEAACMAMRDSMSEVITATTERICSTDLGEIAEMHLERGIVGDGHAHVLDEFRRLLTTRAQAPWFDVDWCRADGSLDLQALSALVLTTVPCDVIQATHGPDDQVRRDVLLTFRNGGVARDAECVEPSPTHSGLRAMQAQFDYLLAHVSSGGIVATRRPSPRKCPFYSSCTLDMRANEGAICREEPWRRLTLSGATCWYGLAVAASLGTVRQG